MRGIFAHLLLLATLLMAGCIASEHPLIAPEQALPVNRSILGVWEDEGHFAEITAVDERTYALKTSDVPVLLQVSATMRIGKIGEFTVADIDTRPPDRPQAAPRHTFAVVQQTSPKLKLAFLRDDWLEAQLKNNAAGLAFKTDEEGKLVLQATTPELQKAFLQWTANLDDEQQWISHEFKRVPGHQTLATMPTTRQSPNGVVQERTGGYTTRPIKRSEVEGKEFRDNLPADADEIQFAEFHYWQAHEGYLKFRASKESCLAFAKAELEDWNKQSPKEATPLRVVPIDKAKQQAFAKANREGAVKNGAMPFFGSDFRQVPFHIAAPWFTPEEISEGVEIEHKPTDTKFWIDTEKGILYRQYFK